MNEWTVTLFDLEQEMLLDLNIFTLLYPVAYSIVFLFTISSVGYQKHKTDKKYRFNCFLKVSWSQEQRCLFSGRILLWLIYLPSMCPATGPLSFVCYPLLERRWWVCVGGRLWRCWAVCLPCAVWACWESPSAQTTGSTWRRESSCLSTRAQRYACPSTQASGESVSWQVKGFWA